jgi:Protein of unknwon function (DUF3310)
VEYHGSSGRVTINDGIGGGGGSVGATPARPSALERQVGGDHYKYHSPQPVEVAWAWNLPFDLGSVLKYLYRWHVKGDLEDLAKLKHWVEMISEHAQITPGRHESGRGGSSS